MFRLFNTDDYTIFELSLNITASVLWVIAYIIIVRNIRRNSFVEIPVLAAVGNIAWELLWSVHFATNMGMVIVWGVRAWLILDLFIVYNIFRRGRKQWVNPVARHHFTEFAAGAFLMWGAFFYTFTSAGFDTPVGGRSALILNLVMSCLYLMMGTRMSFVQFMSPAAAVFKGLGTAFFTLFIFVGTPTDHISMVLGSSVFVVDAVYTWHLIMLRRRDPRVMSELDESEFDGELAELAA